MAKSIFIFGYGPGIGDAAARAFAEIGCELALFARNTARLEEAVARFSAAGVTARSFPIDLSRSEGVADIVRGAVAVCGSPSVTLYNAAGVTGGPALAQSVEAFHADLAISVTSAFAVARVLHPVMKADGGGAMLFTGGGLALQPEYGKGVASLTAGKSALRGLVHVLASEWAEDNIHVGSVVVAGYVAPDTPFAPEKIARHFVRLAQQPAGTWETEFVFQGEP